MSRRARIITALAVLLVAAGIGAYFIVRSTTAGPVVDTAVASKQDLGVTVSASGAVSTDVSRDVYPGTSGTIESVCVSEGATVTAGQTLATLDTAQLDLQVTQAAAALTQAKAQRQLVDQSAPTKAQLNAAQAGIDAAQDAYNTAKNAYDQLTQFYPSDSSTVTAAAVNVSQANAALAQAKAALSQLQQAGNLSAQKASADAGVQAAQKAYDLAVDQRSKATIVAPIGGKVFFSSGSAAGLSALSSGAGASASVSSGKVGVGSAVSPGSAIFTIVDLNAMVFSAEIDEADIERVHEGVKASVSLDSFAGTSFETSVTSVGLTAQTTSTGGTVFVADLPLVNTGRQIRVGMKGDATLQVSEVESALTIPVEALFSQSGSTFVYRIIDGMLERTDVTIGVTTETEIEILSGLKEGDVVALPTGSTLFSDGMKVRIQ
ncbi:MAG: efflux RND transporter periplasmic adaptor subunit [Coriobacteriia bacterium]